jgi:CDP-glycerol glycerophosphotransferase (TagB/SpsB family)
MRSRYIGEGSAAFARMGQVRAKAMLATTPNIGTPGFPMPRPRRVEHLVHVCHGVDDIGLYKKGSLDCYDAVLLVGGFMTHGIRCLEKLRGLKPKDLVPAGLPYLDDLASKMKNPPPPTDGKTILIAPSWGTKGCLFVCGSRFIEILAKAGYNVILRPHPHSWKAEEKLLRRIQSELKMYENIEWDKEPDGSAAMERADVLISDTSNIRMDYALLYERPVVTLKIAVSDPETFELSDMDGAWMDKAESEIGIVVRQEQIDSIAEIVGGVLDKTENKKEKRSLAAFREANVYNFGSSGKAIAEYLVKLIQK